MLAQSVSENLPEVIKENLPPGVNIDVLLNATIAVVLIWLALKLFVYWRRAETNLTPVDVPSAKKDAQPDFLSVNKKKQKSALKRGDAYEKKLARRERVEKAGSIAHKAGLFQRAFGYIAIALAAASALAIVAGSFWPTSFPGKMLNSYSVESRLSDVVTSNPIALVVIVLAIGYGVGRLFLVRPAGQVAG